MSRESEPGGGGAARDASPLVTGLLYVLDDVRDILDEAMRGQDRHAAHALLRLTRGVAACIDTCHDGGVTDRKPPD